MLLVDAAEHLGGTAAVAGGGTCIAGSLRQAALGIDDDIGLALEDWARAGGPTADLDWAERYLRAIVGELWQELAELGVRWQTVRWQEGNRVPRWHAPAGGGRAVMMALARPVLEDPRIRVATGYRLTALRRSGGGVEGALLTGPDCTGEVEVAAAAVVLATGGFSNDAALLREHADPQGRIPRLLRGGGTGATGEAHRILQRTGAGFRNLDAVWMYAYGTPDPDDPSGDRGLAVRGVDGDLWVGRDGQRFHDEARRGGATATPALLQQPGATAWTVIDAALLSRVTLADPRYRNGDVPDRQAIAGWVRRSPAVHLADDLATLAEHAGIDPSGLAATVAERNRGARVAAAVGPGWHRPTPLPVEQPPYAAIQLHPLARKNLGGVRTSQDGVVLTSAGSEIPGLFAAGELAGMGGGSINGRGALEGTMFGPSLFSGTVAGAAAVA